MRVVVLFGLIVAITPGAAHAHADGLPVGPNDLWHHWTLDPLVWAPLLFTHWLYGRGALRAWARAGDGRIVERWRLGAFVAGETVIIIALISPLDALGETLLSAHMAQHILLTTIAPLLLVLGNPAPAWTWALPARWRGLARAPLARMLVGLWRWLTRPVSALLMHVLTLWLWHAPMLFDAALRDESMHTLEHFSFFGTALLFWSAVVRRTTAPAFAALLVLVVFIQCGMLGAILALARAALYDYGDRPVLWDISAVEDQQIAGLLMWAPAGLAYMAPFAWLMSRVIAGPCARGRLRESSGIMRARTSSRSMK